MPAGVILAKIVDAGIAGDGDDICREAMDTVRLRSVWAGVALFPKIEQANGDAAAHQYREVFEGVGFFV